MRVISLQVGIYEGDFSSEWPFSGCIITIYLSRYALIYRLEYPCVTFVRMGTLRFTDVRNHIRFFPTGATFRSRSIYRPTRMNNKQLLTKLIITDKFRMSGFLVNVSMLIVKKKWDIGNFRLNPCVGKYFAARRNVKLV